MGGGQMEISRKYLMGLFVGLVVLGLLSPAVSAGIPGSVTLKIKQETWWAEADVYTTIYYRVETGSYGMVKFSPLGPPYNYIHFGSHSGTGSDAYWRSMTAATSEYKHYASGNWHVEALWNSADGTMEMWLWIEYSEASIMGTKDFGIESLGEPYLAVRYTVDSSGGNTLADEIKNIAIGVVTSYVVSA